MRITVHVPDKVGKEARRLAENEKKSLSSVVAQSIALFINDKKRRKAGERVLRLAGNTRVADDAFDGLSRERKEDDRS